MDGHLTQQLETTRLHTLENRGAILGHRAGLDKFDGYSEAWTKASLNVTSIKPILDWVYEEERQIGTDHNSLGPWSVRFIRELNLYLKLTCTPLATRIPRSSTTTQSISCHVFPNRFQIRIIHCRQS